ncbi:MAG: DUF4302 domain-containing protein [Bacteroides sp.]|uniref:DUF4302 domain-containing protein n=1 Tax=Bacteroides sp. TaxID=29523 RepID=UPI0026DFF3B7|nr:DUF4302 domain-containing protein [Bacteroides sp.]MDO5419532.1 DUF4302 domain-containing protein [Bacteroides sp.]
MKFRYLYLMMLLGVLLGATACVNEEDDLFEDSAAQRMNKAVDENTKLLEGSAEGWVMDFFPGDGSMGGYTHTVVFKDGVAAMTSELSLANSSTGEEWPAGTVVKSLYQVKAEQECLLSFDSYNLLFHFWSEPKGSDSPTGYEGDYEFAFKKIGNDTIVLKGKRYGYYMQLTRLKEPASAYMEKVLNMFNTMAASPRMRIEVGGKTYSCLLTNKQFTCEYGEGEDKKEISMAYLFTENGLRFYQPVTIDGVSFREFTLESDKTLKAKDANVVFPVPTATEIFCAGVLTWNFSFDFKADVASMDDTSWGMLKNAETINSSTQNEKFVNMFLGANPAYPGNDSYPICLGWVSNWLGLINWTVAYGVSMSPVAGSDNQIEIKMLGPGINYSFYGFLDSLVERIGKGSPYKLTMGEGDEDGKVRLESVASPDIWFEVAL